MGLFGDGVGQQPHGILGALSQVFAGQDDPSLSPEQNAAARKRALIQAGLSTIINSSNGNGLAAIAAGAGTGQQAREQYNNEFAQKAQRDQLASLLQGGITPESLRALYSYAIQTGNAALAKEAFDMIQQLTSVKPHFSLGGPGNTVPFDQNTGQFGTPLDTPPELVSQDLGNRIVWYPKGHPDRIVHSETKAKIPGEGDGAKWAAPTTMVDPATNKPRLGQVNNQTGAVRWMTSALPVEKPEDERVTMGKSLMEQAGSVLDKYETDITIRSGYFGRNGLVKNYFNTEAGQAVKQSGAQFVDAVLLAHKIGRPSDKLREMYLHAFIPEPGDKPTTLALKRRARDLAKGGTLPSTLEEHTSKEQDILDRYLTRNK
jgi:hypothetical protein